MGITQKQLSNILAATVILGLATLGSFVITSVESKKDTSFQADYTAFERKYQLVKPGNTIEEVTNYIGPPDAAFETTKVMIRGQVLCWEYSVRNRMYTLSFLKDELVEENPVWRIYEKSLNNPVDSQSLKIRGFQWIGILGLIMGTIYIGFKLIRK